METFTIIAAAVLVGVVSYVIGLRRGIKIAQEEGCEEYKDAYWEGYSDGRLDPEPHIVSEAYEEGYQDGKEAATKRFKADKLIEGLEEAFKDNKVIDCGEY